MVVSPCFASSPSCAFDSLAVFSYPSMFSCSGREIPRAPGGMSRVITDDVPDGALGIARQRQTNIEGYAERKMPKERD